MAQCIGFRTLLLHHKLISLFIKIKWLCQCNKKNPEAVSASTVFCRYPKVRMLSIRFNNRSNSCANEMWLGVWQIESIRFLDELKHLSCKVDDLVYVSKKNLMHTMWSIDSLKWWNAQKKNTFPWIFWKVKQKAFSEN